MATTCTVLGDAITHRLLLDLTRPQVQHFRDAITAALVEFSTTDERKFQPDSLTVVRPDGRSILFRPFTSSTGPGVKIIVDPTSAGKQLGAPGEAPPTLHGILVVCDVHGIPKGLVNAEEPTAYRTAMNTMIPFCWRKHVRRVVVFGAGKVGLWSVRLMLALRGEEVESVVVVNRTIGRAEETVGRVKRENEERWKSEASFEAVASGKEGSVARLRTLVEEADVVLCTTPSSVKVLEAEWVVGGGGRKVSKLITGIGSWQHQMVEIDPELYKAAAAAENGAVMADNVESAMRESGEVIQSGLREDQIYELGKVLGTKDDSMKDVKQKLVDGFVVYKSIGVSVTDLASANTVLELAKDGKLGTTIEDF